MSNTDRFLLLILGVQIFIFIAIILIALDTSEKLNQIRRLLHEVMRNQNHSDDSSTGGLFDWPKEKVK